MDIRERELTQKLVNYSCNVQKNEKVLIQYSACSNSLINCIVEEVFKKEAHPFLQPQIRENHKQILKNGSVELFDAMAKYDSFIMKDMDSVIIIRGEENAFEYSSIPNKQIREFSKIYTKPVHFDIRVNKKWVLLKYPTPAFAQSSKMGTQEFEDYYYSVCNMDYLKLKEAMQPLKEIMDKTNKVRIVAPDTDLTFSIKGINSIPCCGNFNIPDGEIYTAPVKNSVNGYIHFNIPSINSGKEFFDIKLVFENGKVVESSCNNNEALTDILDTDEGSRYLGEFAFGLNPYVTTPIKDILFDEKMTKSIHMALGGSYEDAYNGNDSAVHWDLIQCHDPSYGGGKIYFDDVLIYEDGNFLDPNLVALNRDNLL